MQEMYKPIWISAIAHLEKFSSIMEKNPWWKVLLSMHKVPADFPQVQLGSKGHPIVFFAKGELKVYERQIDFRSDTVDSTGKLQYKNVRTDVNFEIDYASFRKVERYLHPKPFMKAFNISWISITYSNNGSTNDILLSKGGTGLDMGSIKTANDSLFEQIRMRAGL